MDIKPVILNPRSKNITEGKSRAPNRSMYYAMGYQEGDFKKPMVGVANGHSTITPCNSGLQKLADAAIAGNGRVGQLLQAAVARRDGAVAIGYADHGLLEVAFLVSHGVVHRAVGRAGFAFGDVLAARVQDDGFDVHGKGVSGIGLGRNRGIFSAEYAPTDKTIPIYY